jgi:cytochrome c oxidase subunit 3
MEAEHKTHEEHRDYTGSKMGMWIFLFTEILLFGGLFLLYSMYRSRYPQDFHNSALDLNTILGTLNTVILLTSSLFVALSITAVQKGEKNLSLLLLALTIILACAFLVNKYFEWTAEFRHGIYPDSPVLAKHSKGEILFFGLYFVMTGLHGVHVIIGIIVLSIMYILIIKDIINKRDFVKLENAGLYWHIVDIIWIYLFPLFYLIT